jgi:hypothetical protein
MRVSVTLLLFLCVSVFAATPRWTPASFHGLTVGQAHREDALRALGSPDADQRTRDGEELIYKARGDHKGDLSVRLDRSGMVSEIQESFPVAIPRTQIYKELGSDALTARFSWARCAANALYRDPHGALELTFYPTRGIVLWPDQVGYDFAAMLYVAREPGLSRPPACTVRR